ncbi:MAG TPA: serine/threonine-protein kinase, partial [Nannocystaceae bacterium]|nr:serine/threonine-protein kinase [Nannocystaceae bacterium]
MTRDIRDSSSDETLSSLDDQRGDERARMLARGEAIGRYVVIDRIGEGGMGVVYAAYDPELDRKLALKLLHQATGDRAEARRTRLVREAQAMARLSHRNVIAVHDVGTVDDHVSAAPNRAAALRSSPSGPLVFVAMEFIDGQSLAQWLATPRPWRVVLDVLVQAGRGLAAAHDAGLVHRDFKPDNVMIAHDADAEHDCGRVVVTDFGLARAAGTADESSAQHPLDLVPRLAARGSLAATVTVQGAIMGTPAYMAPEQHEGRVADARSDQFAFAVALYEALYRQRPFAGDDLASLAYNVTTGRVREPPASSPVPGWLCKVVVRALTVAPEGRYPSMHALLAELSRDRSVRPRWWAVFLGVGASAATGLYAGVMLETEPAPCTGAQDEIEGVWNPERKDEIHAKFVATGLPYAEEQWPTVRAELDGYAKAWSVAYVDACEDTHVRGEQSEALLDTRMLCLGRRLADFDAVVDLFANADASVVGGALAAVQGLPHLRSCEQVEALLDPVPPPEDPQMAGRVESLRPELARVAALGRAGLHEVGLGAARDLVARTAETDYGPLHGEALEHLAAFEQAAGQWAEAETHLREAVTAGIRGHADMIAARAAVELVGVVGRTPARKDDAVAWAELAEALLVRAGGDPDLEIALFDSRARMLESAGMLVEARAQLERLLAIRERRHGSE